ncbi:hypothetical protein AcW1_005586 [Taiwanofungus camphoratus]|nr:hypothetical protein AcW1_005586 [Antrodia cinnamomea]
MHPQLSDKRIVPAVFPTAPCSLLSLQGIHTSAGSVSCRQLGKVDRRMQPGQNRPEYVSKKRGFSVLIVLQKTAMMRSNGDRRQSKPGKRFIRTSDHRLTIQYSTLGPEEHILLVPRAYTVTAIPGGLFFFLLLKANELLLTVYVGGYS